MGNCFAVMLNVQRRALNGRVVHEYIGWRMVNTFVSGTATVTDGFGVCPNTTGQVKLYGTIFSREHRIRDFKPLQECKVRGLPVS